jgi:hypothetical protein
VEGEVATEFASDPVHLVRQIGSELAPEAGRRLDEMLAHPDLTEAALRETAAEAKRCIELLVEQVHQLETALETRIVIEQAKGLLLASGVPPAKGFQLLVQRSQRENRKLREVALRLVRDAEGRANGHGKDGASSPPG